MSFKQKTWNDRISEHPTRRTLTDVSDNTTKTVTVAREEGTISQEGDAFSAANMNDLESRIADGFSTLSQDSVKIATKNTTSDSIAFGIDSNGNYGYIKEGADTVTPFKSQKDIDNAYNSGVAAADKRVNTGSASYNSGYTNGQASVKVYQYEYQYPYWLSTHGGQMESITINVQSGLNGVSVAFVSAWDSGLTNGGAAMDFSYDKTSGALTISTSLNLNHPTFRVTGYYF